MYNNNFPLFIKGKVVKKEALEGLRDFPHTFVSIAFDNLSDGIVFGFSIFFDKDKNTITVSRGALKFRGHIIIVHENELSINKYGTLLYIKLIVGDYCEKDGFEFYPIEMKINDEDFKENELEIGRFILNKSAVLRCDYDFFSDLRTSINTLDITRCSSAGNDVATLHPNVLKVFAKTLLNNSSDAADISFALLCINSSIIHKNSIEWYIAKKIGGEYREYTLDDLYKKLEEILSYNFKKVESSTSINKNRPRIQF